VDRNGNLYIADSGNNRIRRVTNGFITTFAGNGTAGFSGESGAPTAVSLNTPFGVAVDPAGNVYIADTLNESIRKVSGNTLTTIAGTGAETTSGDGGQATLASIALPVGVAVDSAGSIYIAAPLDESIRKITNGVITTVAGAGIQGFAPPASRTSSISLRMSWAMFLTSCIALRTREVAALLPASAFSRSTRASLTTCTRRS